MRVLEQLTEDRMKVGRKKTKELVATLRDLADELENYQMAFVDLQIIDTVHLNDRMSTKLILELREVSTRE